MKPKLSITSIISSLVGIGLAAMVYHGCKPVWQYDRLEENAKKVISGSELQAWATNVLAQFPTNEIEVLDRSKLGTNFPPQLLSLAPRIGPHVVLKSGFETNSPRWIGVYWGSGFLGASGFEIGPTNFHSWEPNSHEWQPGVYFFRR